MVKVLRSDKIISRKWLKLSIAFVWSCLAKWLFFIYRYEHGFLIDGGVTVPGGDGEILDDGLGLGLWWSSIYSKEYDDLHYDGSWNYMLSCRLNNCNRA